MRVMAAAAAPGARAALLGLAVLAAAIHGAHASLALSTSLVSSQTIDGQWQDLYSYGVNRYVCTEANAGTFTCILTRTLPNAMGELYPLTDFAGVLSRSSNPRIYAAGARTVSASSTCTVPVVEDATTYRFILAANGTQLSVCNPTPGGGQPYSCRTWWKMPNPEGFAFSWAGPIPGMFCVNVNEPQDPPWADNYFCSNSDRGLRWSSNGPISGMKCTLVDEHSDTETAAWSNNYICVPSTSNINFDWSNAGARIDKQCTHWNEPADSLQGWDNNYLCY